MLVNQLSLHKHVYHDIKLAIILISGNYINKYLLEIFIMFNNLKNIPYTDNDNDSNDNNENSDASDDDIFFKRGSGIRFNVGGSKFQEQKCSQEI